jgi:pyruvate dehydrogenase E1 component beta subunit
MAEITIREAITLGLTEAIETDDKVFIMGEDIGEYGGAYSVTKGFLEKYGDRRIKDTPISEAAFVGAGIGAAAAGLRPVVELMSMSFALVAFDQIVNMASNLRYMSGGQIKVPMVIRAPTGAGVQLGATHSQSFETWLAEVPGMYCVCPSNPRDALGLLRTSIKSDNPVIFAEHSHLYGSRGEVPEEYFEVPLGKARIARAGDDLTLVSYGYGVHILLEAAHELAEDGVDAEVIDLRSLQPVDYSIVVSSVQKTGRAVMLDTARRTGGIMSAVVAEVQERALDWLDGPVVRVGSKDVPWPYNRALEQDILPQSSDIVEATRKIISF